MAKSKPISNLAGIFKKKPAGMAQVSTSTLESVHGSPNSNAAVDIGITKELQSRATSGTYEQPRYNGGATGTKKQKGHR